MHLNNNISQFVSQEFHDVPRIRKSGNCHAIVLTGRTEFPGAKVTQAKSGIQKQSHRFQSAAAEAAINNAREQIGKVFGSTETMFVIAEENRHFYERVLADVPSEQLIVQPSDNGTTTAILYTALRLAIINPTAILVIFPADFHAPDTEEFMRTVKTACAFARRDPNLILLGLKPDVSETRKEWIELDSSAPVDKDFGVWRVSRFSAKATPKQVRHLLRNGAFVNSSVMVGTVATFLRKISRYAPEVYERFNLFAERIGTTGEERSVRAAYSSNHSETDFSQDVLEKITKKLFVVPVQASLKHAVGLDPLKVATVAEAVMNSAPKFKVAGMRA